MSRLFRILFIFSLLCNFVLLIWMGTKWMKRFKRQEWVLIQNRMTQTFKPQAFFFLGDSQLDNLAHSGAIAPGIALSNLSVPGYQMADLINVLERMEPVDYPARVILLVGINDLRSGASSEDLMEKYSSLGPLVSRKFPVSEVLVISLFPITEYPDMKLSLSNELIQQVNEKLKKWCDQNHFMFLDAHDLLIKNGHLNPDFTYDGLHLNIHGNHQLARFLNGYLK